MPRRSSRQIKHLEVQILQLGETPKAAFNRCNKKGGHAHYIQVHETARLVETLSQFSSINDNILANFIGIMCQLTAMIELPVGEDVRCGTCFVQNVETVTDTPCPCPECEGQGKKEWGKVTLTTALHVLKDDADATNCKVRFFYDSDESGDKEKIIYGMKSHSRDEKGNWCALVCVTHDGDLLESLTDTLKQYWELGHRLKETYQSTHDDLVVVVVSHPHGGPKCISVGKAKVKDLAREVREEQNWCFYSYDAVTCDGSSGAPVYILGRWNDGFGYWFGHSHNHSGIDELEYNSSTVGVDSTYDQLTKSYGCIAFEKCRFETSTSICSGVTPVDPELVASRVSRFSVHYEAQISQTGQEREIAFENNMKEIQEKLANYHSDCPTKMMF